MSASQVPAYASVPPYLQNYSQVSDVGNKFGNATLFTASTTPSTTQVQDIISRKDSWIDNFAGHDFRFHQVTEYYDGIGSGRRTGQIHLRNSPVLSVERCEYRQEGGDPSGRDAWIPGVNGSSAEAAGVLVGPKSNVQADYFYSYPEKGLIRWGRIGFTRAQKYRVTYSYGYPSPPDWVRDLSATMAAIECLSVFSGKFMPPEPLANYEARFERDVALILTTAGRRPLSGVA